MELATARRSPALRTEQLVMLMQQLRTEAGISIDSTGNAIADCISSRMAYLGISQVDHYLGAFDDSINARAEWLALMDQLTVKETRFFRQPEAFECLAHYVESLLAAGPAPREVSFLSAGCATGQELYSMAMTVDRVLSRREPWLKWHGIGIDISFGAIRQAQQGIYRENAVKTIPVGLQRDYIEPKLGGRVKVGEGIRARTHFFHSNLLHADSVPFADFNIIFCQNVLIYFPRERQRWIIDQLVERLRIGGLLVLGAGEDAGWLNNSVQRQKWPGVCAYKKTGG